MSRSKTNELRIGELETSLTEVYGLILRVTEGMVEIQKQAVGLVGNQDRIIEIIETMATKKGTE